MGRPRTVKGLLSNSRLIFIASLNRNYAQAVFHSALEPADAGGGEATRIAARFPGAQPSLFVKTEPGKYPWFR
jgi:hypothetical protein